MAHFELIELKPCGECGMLCEPSEYHPFAACLMFKGCHDSATVRKNLSGLQREAAGGGEADAWRVDRKQDGSVMCVAFNEAEARSFEKLGHTITPYYTAPRPTGTFGHGLTKEPLTLTTPASAEPRGESTGDTPTFADAWERLTPSDRSIISAYFCEPSRQKPQPAVTSESPGLTSECQAAAHVEEGGRVTDAYDRAWFAECRRVLEDVATEMRATGRGDTRFRRLIESMPRAALKRAEKGEGNG
jgi:hypothetical protein